MNDDYNLDTLLYDSWKYDRHISYLKYLTRLDMLHWLHGDQYNSIIAGLAYDACLNVHPDDYYTGV